MYLDENVIPEQRDLKAMDHKMFNVKYMIKNRPVIIRDLASNWGAVSKWKNFDYLKQNAGTSTSLVSILNGKSTDPEEET